MARISQESALRERNPIASIESGSSTKLNLRRHRRLVLLTVAGVLVVLFAIGLIAYVHHRSSGRFTLAVQVTVTDTSTTLAVGDIVTFQMPNGQSFSLFYDANFTRGEGDVMRTFRNDSAFPLTFSVEDVLYVDDKYLDRHMLTSIQDSGVLKETGETKLSIPGSGLLGATEVKELNRAGGPWGPEAQRLIKEKKYFVLIDRRSIKNIRDSVAVVDTVWETSWQVWHGQPDDKIEIVSAYPVVETRHRDAN